MSGEQTSNDPPSLDESDPTNAKLAAMMVEQTRRILRDLSRIENLIADPSPTAAEIADRLETLLRGPFAKMVEAKDVETLAMATEAVGIFLDRLVIDIRCPRGTASSELAESEAEPIEYRRVEPEELIERLTKPLIKADAQAKMIDRLLALGALAESEKSSVALALAEVFAEMLPDGEQIHEIPEGWAPVALAINPATGEFLTIAGPRSEPDGRIEPLETMLARQMQSSLSGAVGAVREAGRPQPTKVGEFVVTGPIDEGTCEQCRLSIGDKVKPSAEAEYLAEAQRLCECVNGCRLSIEHPDKPGAVSARVKKLEEGSEGE